MKTSLSVNCTGSSTSILSTGEIKVSILPVSEDLEVRVFENEVEVKTFYFRSGTWERYSIIKTDL